MREMRRKNRQVLEENRIDEIIRACDCCRIGLADEDEVYIVPLNFGYVNENGSRIFYFHSAKEGRKLDLIRKTGRGGFELDTNHQIKSGENACDYAFRYQSVIGKGKIEVLENPEEREKGLRAIMEHYTGKSDWTFGEKSLSATAVIKLMVEEICCKEQPAE